MIYSTKYSEQQAVLVLKAGSVWSWGSFEPYHGLRLWYCLRTLIYPSYIISDVYGHRSPKNVQKWLIFPSELFKWTDACAYLFCTLANLCTKKIAAKPLLILQISNFQSHVFFSGDVSHFPCNPKIFQVISLATKNFPIEFLCSKGWVSKMCDSVIDILYSDHCSKRNWFGKCLGHKGNDLGHEGNKRRYWNL
jgi:hypothetical protein